MKQIIVSREKCVGCGACISIDPEHFDFDDEGISKVISNDNLESEELIQAIEACPTEAIYIETDQAKCNCEENCGCDEECVCDNCDCDEECQCEEDCNCNEKN